LPGLFYFNKIFILKGPESIFTLVLLPPAGLWDEITLPHSLMSSKR